MVGAAASGPLVGLVPSAISSSGRPWVSFGQVGVFVGVVFEGEEQMQGNTILLLLSLLVQGKKKTYGAVQNVIVFVFYFFFSEMDETTLLFPKRVI